MKHAFLSFLIACAIILSGRAAMASDEPSYQLLDTPEALRSIQAEVREYDAVLIAYVRVQGNSWRDASSAAFRPLANYIFGANGGKEKIGMTTPVTTHKTTSQKASNKTDDVWEVRFFFPARFEASVLPEPQSPYVRLDRQEQMRFGNTLFRRCQK